VTKASETNRSGFGTPKERKEGGVDPNAAKYRETSRSGQVEEGGSHSEDRTLGREAGRQAGETVRKPR
jgi:general stress protein YciG